MASQIWDKYYMLCCTVYHCSLSRGIKRIYVSMYGLIRGSECTLRRIWMEWGTEMMWIRVRGQKTKEKEQGRRKSIGQVERYLSREEEKRHFCMHEWESVRGRGFLCVQDVSVSTQRQLCAVKVRLYFSYYKLEKSYARGVTFSKLYSEAKAGGGIIYSCVIM